MGDIYELYLKFIAAIAVILLLSLAIISMDCLTYGNPPGLFKGKAWQTVRQLWARGNQ